MAEIRNNSMKLRQSKGINSSLTDDNLIKLHMLHMGESLKFPKSLSLENQNLKLAICLQNSKKSKLNGQIPLDKLRLNQRGSPVVECLTRDREAVGSSLTGITGLCP